MSGNSAENEEVFEELKNDGQNTKSDHKLSRKLSEPHYQKPLRSNQSNRSPGTE